MHISHGLFDLQVNGFAGVDFNDPSLSVAQMDHALEALRATGVTLVLPTLISASSEMLKDRLRALDHAVAHSRLGKDMVPGYHLEGPFLSAQNGYRGCHPEEAMSDPCPNFIAKLEKGLSRPVLLVTLAPEREGATKAIRTFVAQGKVVAMGHSAADIASVNAAVEAGMTLSTHLGNGLPATLPKVNNPFIAQLANTGLHACVIADGIHLHPDVIGAIIQIKGVDKTILVTDAVVAADALAGKYLFAGMEVTLHPDGVVRQGNSPYLAGAALRLNDAIRNVVQWGIADLPNAVMMASDNPYHHFIKAFAANGLQIDQGRIQWAEDSFAHIIQDSKIYNI